MYCTAPTKPLNLKLHEILPYDTKNVAVSLTWDWPVSPNGIVRDYSAQWTCTPDECGNATYAKPQIFWENTTGVIGGLPIDSNCIIELAAVTISTGEFASVNITTPYMGILLNFSHQ